MSHIAFDLDALPLVPKVARSAGVGEAVVGWGLTQMWEWCWREKTDRVTTNHLRGFFGTELGAILVDFGFLEATGSSLWRVKGAARYLRISQAQSDGGKKSRGNLKQYREPAASTGSPTGSPPAPHRLEPEVTRSERTGSTATSDERLATSDKRAAEARPPPKPSAAQEFFVWAQVDASKTNPLRLPETSPKPTVLNTTLKEHITSIGRIGLEAAWRQFMRDEYATRAGWPWGLFVSQLPKFHNQARATSPPGRRDEPTAPRPEGRVTLEMP